MKFVGKPQPPSRFSCPGFLICSMRIRRAFGLRRDVRQTANIRGDLHLKLKILAAEKRTTVGELIEEWIESWS